MSAKDIILRPIDAQTANALVRRVHYSHKVVNNSQVHMGVFYHGKLEGALQFGPSLDKRKLIGLVKGTKWNEFIELNRLAFTDVLPRNSESRALSVALRLLRQHAPHLKWIVTFADATQCGDGTIYRASGFVLTGIRKNSDLVKMTDGNILHKIVLQAGNNTAVRDKRRYGHNGGESANDVIKRVGGDVLGGFQLRYLYFLDPSCKDRLTVPILPYSAIEKAGAGMYRGQSRAGVVQPEEHALQCETALQSDPPALLQP